MAKVVVKLEIVLEQQDITESSVPKEIKIDASYSDETNLLVGEQATWLVKRIPTSPPEDENWISEICEECIYLPKYDWSMIELATDHFSSSNMIGGSGYGPRYYKAVLRSGQIVAVRIFLAPSRQSLATEVIKEILMVQNLQHQNILKLLGYCISKENMILVHEFMENKSLDKFIFGKFQHLQWTQRFKIIMGIAQGVAYLHQDSGMRIIHRDLKPSHILLDNNMNPKISDFGYAKALEEDPSESITTSICGTMGYLCPKYCQDYKVSEMTDVYSFGVVVLEIVSGRKCIIGDHGEHIVKTATDLWKECIALELVDESIRGDLLIPVEEEEVHRCIEVGLLCTQCDPRCRLTMPSVIKLLEGELSMELQELP